MRKTIKDILENKIPAEILENVNRSFEVVGDIAITQIEPEAENYQEEIGKAIMELNKAVKVVLKKVGNHEGEFRTQKLEHIAGENRKETLYTESNIRLKINPEEVYFSPRLSTERELIMKQVYDDEKVLVMFSGCAPYSFVGLRKNPDLGFITSIELNPTGHKYAIENMQLNKNIIQKSFLFEKLIDFLESNGVPAIDKFIAQNLNRLKMHFINGDVKQVIPNLKPRHTSPFEGTDNEIFKKNDPDYIIELLKSKKDKNLYFNFDRLEEPEDLLPYLILFMHKFTFNVIIDYTHYIFETDYEKGLLLHYLEQELTVSIDENIARAINNT